MTPFSLAAGFDANTEITVKEIMRVHGCTKEQAQRVVELTAAQESLLYQSFADALGHDACVPCSSDSPGGDRRRHSLKEYEAGPAISSTDLETRCFSPFRQDF